MKAGGQDSQQASKPATEAKDHSEDNPVSRRNVQPTLASTSKFLTDATTSSRPLRRCVLEALDEAADEAESHLGPTA